MFPLEAFALAATLIAIVYLYMKYTFNCWKWKGVPYVKPSIPFGNFGSIFKRDQSFGENLYDLYNSSHEPVVGIYVGIRPSLLIRDVKITTDILNKDFTSFWHRGFHYDTNIDPLSQNLFTYSGTKWNEMRTMLTQAFSTETIKSMIDRMVECGKSLENCLFEFADAEKEVEIRELFSCYTTNVIASVGFGLDIDSFKHLNHEFREYARRPFEPYLINEIRLNLSFFSPYLAKLFGIRFVDKDVKQFMTKTVIDNLEYRKKNNINRTDIFQCLTELLSNNQDEKIKTEKQSMSIDEITAQAFLFFAAGYESTSMVMTFCIYELARNLDIQQKLYDEICNALQKYGGKFNYESLNEMKYLDCCIDETLRMYPPFDYITRECTKDYKIADTDIVIEQGTLTLFSVTGPQYDSKYYDEPKKFLPDRFIHNQNDNAHLMALRSHMAFGIGPRNCIGIRFAKMLTKVGLCILLHKFLLKSGEQPIINDLTQDPMPGMRIKIKAR